MKHRIDDSVMTRDEIIDTVETGSINSNNKIATNKMGDYILHTFLLLTILLLVIVAIRF